MLKARAAAAANPSAHTQMSKEEDVFNSDTPWSAERPTALVVCCSDGRWRSQIDEFLRAESLDRADVYAVPGGAAVFESWNSSMAEAIAMNASFELLMEHHDIERVWMIAHQGCAYYKVKHQGRNEDELLDRQLKDLHAAREVIQARHPKLLIGTVYARLLQTAVEFRILERPRRSIFPPPK
jgi:hypothetical protein